jgi:hypothetical protein
VDAANAAREANGFRRLAGDPALSRAARAHCRSMAEERFFSHTSRVAGLESPARRVRSAGGEYQSVGENLAFHSASQAAADDFIAGWLDSPGHRSTLMHPEWTHTGVGIWIADGQVYATQLFGVASPVRLEAAELTVQPARWLKLRVQLDIGHDHHAAAFVMNRFMVSAPADAQGRVEIEFELPVEPGSYHVGIGRSRRPESGWIGVYEGYVQVEDGGAQWRPEGQPGPTCVPASHTLFSVEGTDLILHLSGLVLEPAIVVVDGATRNHLEPGPFNERLVFRGHTGEHAVHMGVPTTDNRYLIIKAFSLDTVTGSLREVDS